jgi:hypothetical protein
MSKNDVCPVISVKAFFVCTHTKKAFTDISGQTGHLGHLVVVALKNRMFLQNFFFWPYFGNLLCFSIYPHHFTIPQPNNFIMDCRISLLRQKRMFYPFTSVFEESVLSEIHLSQDYYVPKNIMFPRVFCPRFFWARFFWPRFCWSEILLSEIHLAEILLAEILLVRDSFGRDSFGRDSFWRDSFGRDSFGEILSARSMCPDTMGWDHLVDLMKSLSRRRREKILVKLTRGPQNDSWGHKNSVE